MIRVIELFAGIGACSKALTNLGIEHEIVDAVEIDKYAIKSFNAIHGTNFEPQDITKWDKDIKADLIMHGSPCQDFSVAGKNAGGDEGSGTRSSLLYETLRIVEKVQPNIVIWENVKNLLSKRHKHNHEAYIQRMSDMGYDSITQILNAKDYGIPQNRERVFTLSIKRGSKLVKTYTRPQPRPLEIRLKDVLEPQVDEKYYLSDEQVSKIKLWEDRQKENGRGFRFNTHDGDDIATTMTTSADRPSTSNYYKDPKEVRVAEPFVVASRGRNPNNPSDRTTGAPTVQRLEPRKDGVTNTITSVQKDNYVANSLRIRKLTPRECWRLMGFDDADFDKAQAVGISNTQLYKQAGNSIVVNCLEAIFNGIEWGDNG